MSCRSIGACLVLALVSLARPAPSATAMDKVAPGAALPVPALVFLIEEIELAEIRVNDFPITYDRHFYVPNGECKEIDPYLLVPGVNTVRVRYRAGYYRKTDSQLTVTVHEHVPKDDEQPRVLATSVSPRWPLKEDRDPPRELTLQFTLSGSMPAPRWLSVPVITDTPETRKSLMAAYQSFWTGLKAMAGKPDGKSALAAQVDVADLRRAEISAGRKYEDMDLMWRLAATGLLPEDPVHQFLQDMRLDDSDLKFEIFAGGRLARYCTGPLPMIYFAGGHTDGGPHNPGPRHTYFETWWRRGKEGRWILDGTWMQAGL